MSEVKKIAVIAGDGIGPEVVAEAEKVLKKRKKYLATPSKPSMRCLAASLLMSGEHRFRRIHWKSAAVQMLYCWGLSADQSGTTTRRSFVRKQDCSESAKRWACSPTCVRQMYLIA